MLIKRYIFYFEILILFSAFFSCQQNDTVCTLEWRAFTINIKDSSNKPVILDEYYTKNISTGEIISFSILYPDSDRQLKLLGSYLLITDEQKHWERNGFIEFVFKGFIDSIEIVSENYTLNVGVCHIQELIGNINIVINK